VFQYALVDRSGRHDLAALRSLQDWQLRYHLQAVPGVAEVAAVGGFVKQYQVTADPARLLATGVPLPALIDAVRKGNVETGGRLLEVAGTELMVRGRGTSGPSRTPRTSPCDRSRDRHAALVKHVASVMIGSSAAASPTRRGWRHGRRAVMRPQNALTVIDRVKAPDEIRPSLPGAEIVTTYDR
jgi:Cu(I)/Ag(I) efflux system membrane protein CusA/SilA